MSFIAEYILTKTSTLMLGTTLKNGEYIQNNVGLTFGLNKLGYLELYHYCSLTKLKTFFWKTQVKGGHYLNFDRTGDLILFAIIDGHIQKIWTSSTSGTKANMLILDGMQAKIVHRPQHKSIHLSKEYFTFEANQNLFGRPVSAGVVLIGSLLWQLDGSKPNQKNLRKKWRDKTFEKNTDQELVKIPVKFPIRYGRASAGNVYTMVVSNSYSREEKLGTAMLLKVRRKLESMHDVLDLAYSLARAEGMTTKDSIIKTSWAFISYAINKNSHNSILSYIENYWSSLASQFDEDNKCGFYDIFKMQDENESSAINKFGQLEFFKNNWLKANSESLNYQLENLDFVLTTVTKPCLLEGKEDRFSKYPTQQDLIGNVLSDTQRHYFLNNYLNKISTHDDKEIINYICGGNKDKKNVCNFISPYVYSSFEMNKGDIKLGLNSILFFSYDGELMLYNSQTLSVLWRSNCKGGKAVFDGVSSLLVLSDSKKVVWSKKINLYEDVPKDFDLLNAESSLIVHDGFIEIASNVRGVVNNKFTHPDAVKKINLFNVKGYIGNYVDEFYNCKGFVLKRGESIVFRKIFKVILANDGCLEFYALAYTREVNVLEGNDKPKLLWRSINTSPADFLVYDFTGHLNLYRADGVSVWSTADYNYQKLDSKFMAYRTTNYLDFIEGKLALNFVERGVYLGNIIVNNVFDLLSSSPFMIRNFESAYFGAGRLYFENRLFVYNSKNILIWSSPENCKGDRLEFQPDGNLVIYNGSNPVWSTDTFYYKGSQKTNKFSYRMVIMLVDTVLSININQRSYVDESGKVVNLPDLDWDCKKM